MSKGKLALMLLALAVALVAYITKGRNQLDAPNSNESTQELFSSEIRSQLNYLGLLSRGKTFVFLKPPGQLWEMESPLVSRVSEPRFERLLDRIFAMRASEKIPMDLVEEKKAYYGLEAPFAFLRLKTESETQVLSIGKQNRLSGRYYAQLQSSSDIYLIDGDEVEELLTSFNFIRNRQVFDFVPENIESIVLLAPGREAIHFKNLENSWTMESAGQKLPMSQKLFLEALEELPTLRADGVSDLVGPEESIYGLDDRATVFSVEYVKPDKWGQNFATARFGVGANITHDKAKRNRPSWYVKLTGVSAVFKFLSDPFQKWRKPLENFRPLLLFPEMVEITRIERYDLKTNKVDLVCISKHCQTFVAPLSKLRVEKYLIEEMQEGEVELALRVRFGKDGSIQLALFRNSNLKTGYFVKIGEDTLRVNATIAADQAKTLLELMD